MTTGISATAVPTAPFRLASVLSVCCLLAAIALPTFAFYEGITNVALLIQGFNFPKPVAEADLTAFQRIAAALIDTVSPALQAYGLLCARRCFQSFARGEFFTLRVVKALRGFAAGIFFSIIAATVAGSLLSVLLTMNVPGPGGHMLSIGITSDQVLKLLFTGIFWQIAAVMMRAVSLAEENSQFI